MELCQALRQEMGELYHCAEVGQYLRVRTPYLYPDGDYIDVFMKRCDDVLTVSDLAETVRWLRMQTPSPRRSRKQRQMIEDICLNHGVEFYRGMLSARCGPEEKSLAATITRVAQAALRVSDIWLTFRTRAFESISDEVAELLEESKVPFDRGETLVGRSGRSYTIDFHARAPRCSSLICVLSTGSRSATRRVVEHVLATWFDLNHLKVGPEALQFVSLFDDTMDVWGDEDFRLVEGVSQVARWSAPDQFRRLLMAA